MTLELDDPVVTPSGRHAQIKRRMPDGRLELRYIVREPGVYGDSNSVVLHEKYLRRIVPGRALPAPVRVNGANLK